MSGARARSGGADDWVERVRAASDIVEVVQERITLKRVGRNMVGLCPFHEERTPSFSVHPERQFYHCFSCKAGGDVFKFIQETEHVGFLEAVELLSRRAGIPAPERRSAGRGQRGPLLEALEAAAASYEHWLGDPTTGSVARSYLEKRGIETAEARTYRLGVAPPGWEHLLRRLRDRHPHEALVQAGLVVPRDGGRTGFYDRFRNRLMVPLISPGGQVVGFGARALAPDDQPKYLNSPESPVYRKSGFLFGYEQARRDVVDGGEIVVVEGYFDAIALHQAGVRNVVATSGTALTAEHARLLRRAVSRVALTYDGDAAGQDAMLRSLGVLLGAGLDVAVVTLAGGEDPDTLVRRGGAAAWEQARAAAVDPIAFIERQGARAPGPGDRRERALRLVVELVSGLEDPIRLRLLLERAAQTFGIEERVLARAVGLRRTGGRSHEPVSAAVRVLAQGERRAELELLQGLLCAPEHLEEARRHLSPEDFLDLECGALARRVWAGEPAEEGPSADLARELLASGEEAHDWGSVVAGRVRQMVRRRLDRELKAARQRIRQLQEQGRTEDPETVRLLRETQALARSISELNR